GEVGRLGHHLRTEHARVRPLEYGDARVLAQAPGELPVADVDREHPPGATLEETVGEAAGRRADVYRDATADVDAERIERAGELLAAAAHIGSGLRAQPAVRLGSADGIEHVVGDLERETEPLAVLGKPPENRAARSRDERARPHRDAQERARLPAMDLLHAGQRRRPAARREIERLPADHA